MPDNMRDALERAGFRSSHDNREATYKAGPRPNQTQAPANAAEPQDYTLRAENVILELKKERDYSKFTTSKIRNILSLVSEIYNDVLSAKGDVLSTDIQNRLLHLKVRLIYECGREQIIKQFYEKAGLEKMINDIKDNRNKFIAFARYMEALVAYHRFYGGRD